MKLIELRKDGYSVYVKSGEVVFWLTKGWDIVPTVKAKRCS